MLFINYCCIYVIVYYVFRLYVNGINPQIQELYPKITYPVSRGTPSIHSLSLWDHHEQWQSLTKYLEMVNFVNKFSFFILNNYIFPLICYFKLHFISDIFYISFPFRCILIYLGIFIINAIDLFLFIITIKYLMNQ